MLSCKTLNSSNSNGPKSYNPMMRCVMSSIGRMWCFGLVILAGAQTPCAGFCEINGSVQSATSVESILSLAASSPTNLSSQFVVDQDDGGFVL